MLAFIVTVIMVSLSGTLSPGPITVATLAAGTRNRHAGLMVGLGHIAIEFPVLLLLAGGASAFFNLQGVRTGINLAGGLFLLLMGIQLLLNRNTPDTSSKTSVQRHPFLIGVLLTAINPYFFILSTTVGLELALNAVDLGFLAILLLAILHWSCDLGWLEVLSLAGHKGSEILGGRGRNMVFLIIAVVLLVFGGKFMFDGGMGLFR